MSFKKQREGGQFKNRNFGDLGIGQIARAGNQERSALQTAKTQVSSTLEDNLRGVERVAATELEVRGDIKNFNDIVKNREERNIERRRDQEYKKLMDEAATVGQAGQFWGQFSATLGKDLGTIAGGLVQQANRKKASIAAAKSLPYDAATSIILDEGLQKADNLAVTDAGELYKAGQSELALMKLTESARYPVEVINSHAERESQIIDQRIDEHAEYLGGRGVQIGMHNVEQVYNDLQENIARASGFLTTGPDGQERYAYSTEVTRWRTAFEAKKRTAIDGIKDKYLESKGKKAITKDYNILKRIVLKNEGGGGKEFNRLITTQLLSPTDAKGTFPNLPEAFEAIFVEKIGKDVDISLDEKLKLLKSPSLNWGPHKPQKEGETWEDRISGAEERVTKAHNEAMQEAAKEVDKAVKGQDTVYLTRAKQKQLGIGDYAPDGTKANESYINNPDLLIKDLQEAKELGLSDTVSYLNQFIPEDTTKYNNLAQVKTVTSMIHQGDVVRAAQVIDNDQTLQPQAKKEILAKNPLIQRMNKAGVTFEAFEEESKEILKGVLKFNPLNSPYITPSLERSANRFERLVLTKFNSIEGKTDKEAYTEAIAWATKYVKDNGEKDQAWEYIDTGVGSKLGTGGTKAFRVDHEGWGDINPDTGLSAARENDFATKIRANPNLWKTERILSKSLVEEIQTDLNAGNKITIPRAVIRTSKLSGAPIYQIMNSEFARDYNKPGYDFTLMKPSAADIATSNTLGNPAYNNYNNAVIKADNNAEVALLNYGNTLGWRTPATMETTLVEKNQVFLSPVAPILTSVIKDPSLTQALGSLFFKFPTIVAQPAIPAEMGVDGTTVVKPAVPEVFASGMNIQHIMITNPLSRTFRVFPETDTWNILMQHGSTYGIDYDGTTRTFYYGGY
tara:strand:+ start:967 stop:3684 length:2718 start_codon:yes stop_codon:yes gene_type:complete